MASRAIPTADSLIAGDSTTILAIDDDDDDDVGRCNDDDAPHHRRDSLEENDALRRVLGRTQSLVFFDTPSRRAAIRRYITSWPAPSTCDGPTARPAHGNYIFPFLSFRYPAVVVFVHVNVHVDVRARIQVRVYI